MPAFRGKRVGRALLSGILLSGLVSGLPASASDEFKVGVVDVEAILSSLPERAAVEDTLKTKFAALRKEVDARWDELARLNEELKGKELVLSRQGLEPYQEALIKKETALSTYWNETADRIRGETKKLSSELSRVVEQVITDFARKNGYALMFDKSSGKLIYASEGYDCTAAALKAVLARSDPELAPSLTDPPR